MPIHPSDSHPQYAQPDLLENIRRALRKGGKTFEDLTLDESAAFSEFHVGGRRATRDLAARAGMRPGMRVLDLGCGLGGPARTLAAELGCIVTGIDATRAFCETARALNEQCGLDASIDIIHGDILSVELNPTFDVIWLQHVAGNVEDDEALLSRVAGWVTGGGRLVYHEIFRGEGGPPHFPVPWADAAESSHLEAMETFFARLESHGFRREWTADVSTDSLVWFERGMSRMEDQGIAHPKPPGLDLVMGPRAADKMRNVMRNLREDRIRIGQGVWRRVEE